MTRDDIIRMSLEALEDYEPNEAQRAITALREQLAQPNEFNPDWDVMGVMVAEQQRMAIEVDNLKRRLKSVNTAAMRLTSDLTCMEVDDDDRLDRDRVMERVMQWRNEWDKAMHNNQPQMQPCAGRNCGSTHPNLHSAECFEDYEKSTGMAQPEQHQDWCASLTQMLLSMPPKPAPCNCKPAQPEQEPVAQEWRYYFSHSGVTGKPDEVVGPCFTDRKEVAFGVGCFDQTALYTTPPRREWVGLSDEEIKEIIGPWGSTPIKGYTRKLFDQIEAKLKEKNA